MINVNLNLYKYFYEVAYYGSYSKASLALLISQPSLSYSVKVLESQLNKKLFNRTNRGIELTKYGKELYDELSDIFIKLQNIIESDNKISGKVILGVRSAFAFKVLPFYINELAKIYPELQIEYVIISRDNAYEMLNKDEVDIVIDENTIDDFYSIETDSTYRNILFSTGNYEAVDLSYLEKNGLCIVKNNKIYEEMKKKYPSIKYIPVQSTSLLIDKVKRENIVGISSEALIKEEINNSIFKIVNSDITIPSLKLYITRKNANNDKKINAVFEFFKSHFGYYDNY